MNTNINPAIHDAGGVRPLVARWTIQAKMVLESAVHLGGGAGDIVDMVILRDERSGRPLLPGTSLAGALRSHLADVLGGYRSQEDKQVTALFGGARGDDLGSQSPLIVFDSLGELPENEALEIRDGVQIDPAWGIAEDKKKFDFEVLPAGTTFTLRFDLLVPDKEKEGTLISLLVTALKGLAYGEIALGARRSRGLGTMRANRWRAIRYDLSTRDGWLRWLLSDHKLSFPGNEASSSPAEACRNAYSDINLQRFEDKRKRIVAELELHIDGSLLIRSAPGVPDAPDVVHLHSAGRPVLPGTSLAGALRSHALKVARLMRADDGEQLVTQLFGPRLEGTASEDFKPAASKIRISESFIENSDKRRQTRIAVDRFTGGVIKGALFDEQVQRGGILKICIEVRNPTEEETGLLILLIRDFLSGEISVGGGSSVGRGMLKGTGKISFPDGQNVIISKNLQVSDQDREILDGKIKAFAQGGNG